MSSNPARSKRESEANWKRSLPITAYVGVLALLAFILVARTVSRDDFLVFHQVAQRFWDGVRPYDPITFGNMVFKYPPWILPFFLPFSALDVSSAKTLWGLIEAGSLVAVAYRLRRGTGRGRYMPVRPWIQALFLLSLFGLVGSHGMTGQITLPMLALALWFDPLREGFWKFFALVCALSAKMTSLFPLLFLLAPRGDGKEIRWSRLKRLGLHGLGTLALFILLSLPIYFKSYHSHSKAMRVEWGKAMFSGTEDVNSVRIGFTTREVQGLPSLLLRKLDLDEKKPKHVMGATLFSVFLLGLAWGWASRKLPSEAQWIGWLALLPAVQPLAWFHTFLFAYPLLVVGAEAAIRSGSRRFWFFFACALLIGAVTAKTLGAFGNELELWSIKLWGTLGALACFVRMGPLLSREKARS